MNYKSEIKKKKAILRHDRSRPCVINTTDIRFLPDAGLFGPIVDQLTTQKKWDEIIELLTPRLRRHGDEHWVHQQLATAYFEKLDSELSLDHLLIASELHDSCPFTDWLWVRTFFWYDQYDDAIYRCHWIIQLGVANIMLDSCCRNRAAAKSLINDCHFMLAATYKQLKKRDLAKKEMTKYENGIKKGIATRIRSNPLSLSSQSTRLFTQ